MLRRLFTLILICLALASCEVPDDPTGLPGAPGTPGQPSAIPSESPDSSDPLCFQALQCIVDNANDNALRRQAQEVVNQLFLSAEPQYTQICESRAAEFVVQVPQCQR